MEFNTKLLETLICPIGKDKLLYKREKQKLFSKKSKIEYRIENGIPILFNEKSNKIK